MPRVPKISLPIHECDFKKKRCGKRVYSLHGFLRMYNSSATPIIAITAIIPAIPTRGRPVAFGVVDAAGAWVGASSGWPDAGAPDVPGAWTGASKGWTTEDVPAPGAAGICTGARRPDVELEVELLLDPPLLPLLAGPALGPLGCPFTEDGVCVTVAAGVGIDTVF